MKLAVTKMNNVALESSINEDRSHISSRKQKSLDLLGEEKKRKQVFGKVVNFLCEVTGNDQLTI